MKQRETYGIPENKMAKCLKLVFICCDITGAIDEANVKKALPNAFKLFDSFSKNNNVKIMNHDKLQTIEGICEGVLYMTANGKFKYFIKHIRNAICHGGIKWNRKYIKINDEIKNKTKTAIGSLKTSDFETFLELAISDYEHLINK